MTHPADNPLSRRRFGAFAASGLAATALPAALPGSAAAAAPRACYEPTWPSVDRHTAAPEWFQDAKFGVYWQWSITDTGTNIFVIANRATGLVLDSGGNVASGSPLKLWTDDGSPNLRWGFSVV